MAAAVASSGPGLLGLPASGLCASSDDASVVTDQVSSTDCSEGRAARLAAIQEVLAQIFEYYSAPSGTCESRVLTSARFNKLLLDSSVIDERLSNAKADLVFAKVCGHASNTMNSEQFLDAVVQLAKQKFPQLNRVQGITKIYCNHFASFNAAPEEPAGGLAPDLTEVLAEARSGLQALYRIYFKDCMGVKSTGPLSVNFQSVAQDAWVQFLSDYEVLPEFAQKPMVFAAFREVSQLKAIPQHVRQQVLGDDGQDVGRVFTYVHFALSLVALARRCFADFDAGSLVRLFQWMDESKGQLLAASRGSVGAGGLKILGGLRGALAQLQLCVLAGEGDRNSGSRSSRGSVAQGGRQSVSIGALRKSIGGLRNSQAVSASGRPSIESVSTILARASRLAETLGGAAGALAEGASAKAESLVHAIFAHYAALGDPHNLSHMSLQNFRRFLRDCGLVASEGGRSDFFEFVPAERVQQARRSLGGPAVASPPAPAPAPVRRASSSGALGGGRWRGSVAGRQQGASSPTALSPGERSPSSRKSLVSSSSKDLPLRVYRQAPLTPVDADLIFVQAIRGAEAPEPARELARRRQSSFAQAAAAAGGERQGQRTRMARAAFSVAVQTLSVAVFRGEDEEADLTDMLEEFCGEVLEPLSQILLGDAHKDVRVAVELLAGDEGALFARGKPGLERVFAHYARSSQKSPQQHWTAEDMSKFVRDFGLAGEVGQRPLQQIFRSCASYERFDLKDMSFTAFQLALAIISQRLHNSVKYRDVDKVLLFFHRLNSAAREESYRGPKPPNSGSLIPGLPSLATLSPQDAPLGSGAADAAAAAATAGVRARRHSGSGAAAAAAAARRQAESWAGVLEDEDTLEA